jgi:hypothetical protein
MDFKKLSLADKKVFRRFLAAAAHELAVYSFANIYIWRGLFDIFWAVIDDSLCLFFRDKTGTFMNLCPLGKSIKPEVLGEVFKIMDGMNKNPAVSRIENAEAKDTAFLEGLGYACRQKPADYLCLRKDLAELKGDPFKSKRACVNYFIRNHKSQYLAYRDDYRQDCLKLYKSWMLKRQDLSNDPVYRGMLLDSFSCLEVLLRDYPALDCLGRVVKIDGEIKGFTFGFELNRETFCILFEITDLSCKGLSQYIFRQICAQLDSYKYINIMDDSGLTNLKKVKESYRPARLIPSFIITRKDG